MMASNIYSLERSRIIAERDRADEESAKQDYQSELISSFIINFEKMLNDNYNAYEVNDLLDMFDDISQDMCEAMEGILKEKMDRIKHGMRKDVHGV